LPPASEAAGLTSETVLGTPLFLNDGGSALNKLLLTSIMVKPLSPKCR
jgi:hypothetical protein